MATQFGDRIRELRTKQSLLLRQVASILEVDPSIVSKIELGERKAKKEQVVQLADIFKTSKDELLTLWLADQVYEIVKDEDVADDALKSVSKKIKKHK
jgi:transcriptional regulator with XRE-family HTH domain